MKTYYNRQPTIVFLSCISFLLILLLLPGTSQASRGKLRMTTSFDNGLVDTSHPDKRHFEILLTAPETMSGLNRTRLPLNIALVIDSSGSMSGEKIEYAKQAAKSMINHLQPGDRFSLITYANQAQVMIASELYEEMHQTGRRLIERIRPDGGTNIGAGLDAGYREVQKYYSPAKINRVMLLSDGQANQGVTSSYGLGNIVQREADNDISLSTFGIGLDFNENLMATLSENGRGMYYFIDSPERIPTILAREFSLTEQVVATGIMLEIDLNPGVRIDKVYANKYDIRGNKLVIFGGDLSVGERRRYQIILQPPTLRSGVHRMGKVHLSYTPPGTDRQVYAHQNFKLIYKNNIAGINTLTDQKVTERSLVFHTRYALEDAAKAVDNGNTLKAKKIISQARAKLQGKIAQSDKIRKEAEVLDSYAASLQQNLNHKEKSKVQKNVKYRQHMLEGC